MKRLEKFFQLTATEIAEAILGNNRCLMNLKGAIAQVHLATYLGKLITAKKITGFDRIDKDGEPDFKVYYKDKTFLMECKNVQKASLPGRDKSITIDFWKTRYQKTQGPISRFYHEKEFAILAACLFNRSEKWEFRFIRTKALPRHPKDKTRFHNRVSLAPDTPYAKEWKEDLMDVLTRLGPAEAV